MIESIESFEKEDFAYLLEKLALSYQNLYPGKPVQKKKILMRKLDEINLKISTMKEKHHKKELDELYKKVEGLRIKITDL